MKYEQMSIYDFILNGESQEVVKLLDEMKVMTSESQPQVDEAQEVKAPSSDLDASIPIEDTDTTLFSVGDTVKVRQADEVYDSDESPEDYYYLKRHEGNTVTITGINDRVILTDRAPFYMQDLK